MLSKDLKNQLSQYLALLESDITFQASFDKSKASKDLKEFLDDVLGLSDRLSLVEKDHELSPSFEILKDGKSKGVRFAGTPLGHEFESFVLALLQVSGRAPKIKEDQVQAIKAIDEKIHFETIVSLSCHNCPDVVQALNIMAVLNPNISHTMIEGGAFEDLVEERKVMAVPTVFKNGEVFNSGRISFDDLLSKISGEKKKTDFSKYDKFDVLVVGGGPAAGSAAIYAARKGLKTAIVCDEFGGQVNETLGIENIIGIKYTEGPKYMAQVKDHAKSYDIEIIEGFMAEDFTKNDEDFKLKLESGDELKAKSLIIATGARWRLLGIKGEVELRNKGVAYCTHCDGPLFKDKKIAVIGGGNSGIEAAIDLASIGKEVTVLEFADHLNADQVLQDKLKELSNVKVITSAQTSSIDGEDKVTGLTYTDRKTGESHSLDLDGVFILVGLDPNIEWTKDKLDKNKMGEILVDKNGSTSIPGVFAAGDCTDVAFKQIVISLGSGATAGLGAFNYLIRQ